MSSIPMMIRKMVEILLTFLKRWSQLGKGFEISISDYPLLDRLPHEVGLSMGGKRSIDNAFFQGKAGVRNISEGELENHIGVPLIFSSLPAVGRHDEFR